MQMPIFPEPAVPTPECPNPSEWRAYDRMSAEVEVLDLLYSLVRALRPKVVLETGSYIGLSTCQLARAVRANGQGFVYSCDADHGRVAEAIARLNEESLSDYATVFPMRGIELIAQVGGPIPGPVDFAFIDSGLLERTTEVMVLLPKVSRSGILAIHDTNTHHGQNGRGPRTELLRLGREADLQVLFLDTPRGLALLRPTPPF